MEKLFIWKGIFFILICAILISLSFKAAFKARKELARMLGVESLLYYLRD